MTGRIFSVSITVTTLVQADDELDAVCVAKSELREIIGDVSAQEIAVGVMAEITAISGLPDGWDGQCLPYGGNGSDRISKLLPERAP